MLLFLLSGGSALVKVVQAASLLQCAAKSVWGRRKSFLINEVFNKNKKKKREMRWFANQSSLTFNVATVAAAGLSTNCVEHIGDLVSHTGSSSKNTYV